MRIRILSVLLLLLATAVLSVAQTASNSSSEFPKQIPSFDLTAIDKTADPCVDFYQYACGNWMKNNPIPADKTRWGRFNELSEHNLYVLRDILEQAGGAGQHSAIQKKVGDYYAACMDEATIEKKGAAPLQPAMERIAAIKTKQEIIPQVAAMHRDGIPALFSFYPMPDMHDSQPDHRQSRPGRHHACPIATTTSRTMPSRWRRGRNIWSTCRRCSSWPATSPTSRPPRPKRYWPSRPGLAKAAMDRTARRDPKNRDHMMQVTEIAAAAPNFELVQYFADNGSPKFTSLNVGNPDFFKAVNEQIDAVSLDDWKTYLRWRTLDSYAPLLTQGVRRTRTSNSTGSTWRDRRRSSRAGSAACAPPTAISAWRWARLYVDKVFGPGRQGAHAEDGAGHRERHAQRHRAADLDVGHHQAAGLREAERHRQQHRLSGQVARLQHGGRQARRLCRQRDARRRLRGPAPVQQDREADRPQGLGDDAADGECLLSAADERHQLSRRHSAAAVLRRTTWTTR